jgi:hypothetical protein
MMKISKNKIFNHYWLLTLRIIDWTLKKFSIVVLFWPFTKQGHCFPWMNDHLYFIFLILLLCFQKRENFYMFSPILLFRIILYIHFLECTALFSKYNNASHIIPSFNIDLLLVDSHVIDCCNEHLMDMLLLMISIGLRIYLKKECELFTILCDRIIHLKISVFTIKIKLTIMNLPQYIVLRWISSLLLYYINFFFFSF